MDYRTYPILETPPDRSAPIRHRFIRDADLLDTGIGPIFTDLRGDHPWLARQFDWTFDSATEVADFEAFLTPLQGRYGAFWIPTWDTAAEIVSLVSASLTIRDIGYRDVYVRDGVPHPMRRDIAFVMRDGSIHANRIQAAAAGVADDTEMWTLESAPGINLADVRLLTWLLFARLDSDVVEIAWETTQHAAISLPVAALPSPD